MDRLLRDLLRIPTIFAILVTCTPAPALSQSAPRLLRVLGGPDDPAGLYRVRAAAFGIGGVVVLTGDVPAVHVFDGTPRRIAAWGRRGRGPAELTEPQNLLVVGDRILVRDSELQKISTYSPAGVLLATRPLTSGMAVRVEMAGRDTLVELFQPSGQTLVRLRGIRVDTVLRYSLTGPTVRLSAPGSASLTIPLPYSPKPLWTGLPDGGVAYWNGRDAAVDVLDSSGRVRFRMRLPSTRFRVTRAAREAWYATAIPARDPRSNAVPWAAGGRATGGAIS